MAKQNEIQRMVNNAIRGTGNRAVNVQSITAIAERLKGQSRATLLEVINDLGEKIIHKAIEEDDISTIGMMMAIENSDVGSQTGVVENISNNIHQYVLQKEQQQQLEQEQQPQQQIVEEIEEEVEEEIKEPF